MSRILVIDDDSGRRLILKSRLSDGGHEVVVADTGARGLVDARGAAFDAFIVAVRLEAGVDGYEVCRRLKAIPERAHVPVVLFNDQAGANDDAGRAYEAGCDAFVTRPDLPTLDHVLRALLRSKKRVEELSQEVRALHESARRVQTQHEERPRSAHHEEHGHRENNGEHAAVLRELAAGRPDGLLVVDADGTVRHADRGACEMLGSRIEGMHLGSLAPASGLEAFARDARVEAREGFRFDLPARKGRSTRSMTAVCVPLLVRSNTEDSSLRVLLFHDAAKRRLAAEMLRVQEPGIPRVELGPLLEAAREVYRPEALLGTSTAAADLRTRISVLAQSAEPVLIRGECGTGKERVARILHYSGSSTGAFLHARCGGHAPENLETELFGYAKNGSSAHHSSGSHSAASSSTTGTSGATATVANGDRPGLFHLAQDGTLFLEEIGELTPELQQRVLRFLLTNTVQKRGAPRAERLDLRLIASSSASLEAAVHEERFSRELFDLLARATLNLPRLADRKDDIEPLARHFVGRFGVARHVQGLSDDVTRFFRQYDWPGNLSELEDCLDQACALASGGIIEVDDLPRVLRDAYARIVAHEIIPAKRSAGRAVEGTHSVAGLPTHEIAPHPSPQVGALRAPRSWDITDDDPVSLDLYEKKALLRALDEVDGDKLAAAKLLKVGKSTLYRKLKRFGIT